MATKYSVYNPNAAGDDAAYNESMKRLMALNDARQKFTNKTYMDSEKQRQEDIAMKEATEWEGMGGAYGSAAQGALIGTGIEPGLGTAIGGLGGLILGAGNEISQRQSYKRAHGDKGYSFGNALEDTFLRAPTGREIGSILPAAGKIATQAFGGDKQATYLDDLSELNNDRYVLGQQAAAKPLLSELGGDASNPFSSAYKPPPESTAGDFGGAATQTLGLADDEEAQKRKNG